MNGYKLIPPDEATNAIKLIGHDWFLIGANDAKHGRANAMTADWGAVGELWGVPVFFCFIREQRYTYELVETEDRLSFSFFGEELREALRYCGRESGRFCDKLSDAGLAYCIEDGVPVFRDAKLTFICRKLYSDDLKKANFIVPEPLRYYPDEDFHRFYICQIEKCLVKE